MSVVESPPFDAVIPFHPKDADVLPYCIAGLSKNTAGLRNIYVISKEDPEEDVIWVPEASFSFSLTDVASIIQSTNGREGWYFQQLLKLYAFRTIPDILPHVLLFDADCIMCRPVEFFQDGKILFDWGEKQGHEAYFTHARAIMGDLFQHVDPEKSGITDHMMVHQPIMESLLQKIETRGKMLPAWRIFLEAVAADLRNLSGMSEYEIYYNYALTWFAEQHGLRELTRGVGTSFRALTEGSDKAHIIAIHNWLVNLHKSQIESSRSGEVTLDEKDSVTL